MGGGVKFTAGKKSAKINVYNHLSVCGKEVKIVNKRYYPAHTEREEKIRRAQMRLLFSLHLSVLAGYLC